MQAKIMERHHFLEIVYLFAATLCATSFAADPAGAGFAWQDTNTYRPPNFEAHFPNEPESARELEQLWRKHERQGPPPETVFETLRRGLRAADHKMPILRWFGNEYIWGKSPQDPRAIDLMYHAAGSTNSDISYNAIYFGLSTVRPMTEPILHALVDIAMRSEDPNTLSRVAWGGSAHKDRLQHYLEPHLASQDAAHREHAQTLEQIFSGKLKAFAWAAEQARKKAEAKYSDRLEEFRATLTNGNTEKRWEVIELIGNERIALTMDESFIPAFAAAANDPDREIRKQVAIIVGQRWVWNAQNQAPEAIDLIMKLSRDPNREVRYNANYYGLSTIRHRTDEDVERMIEMALHDGLSNGDFRGRVTWGLERSRELVRTVLKNWLAAYKTDRIRALYAYGFYIGFLKDEPKIDSGLENILAEDEPAAMLLVIHPVQGRSLNNLDEYVALICKELPAPYNSPVRWNNDEVPILIAAPDDVDKIEKAAAAGGNRFKIAARRPLSAQNLAALGKGVRLQEIK